MSSEEATVQAHQNEMWMLDEKESRNPRDDCRDLQGIRVD